MLSNPTPRDSDSYASAGWNRDSKGAIGDQVMHAPVARGNCAHQDFIPTRSQGRIALLSREARTKSALGIHARCAEHTNGYEEKTKLVVQCTAIAVLSVGVRQAPGCAAHNTSCSKNMSHVLPGRGRPQLLLHIVCPSDFATRFRRDCLQQRCMGLAAPRLLSSPCKRRWKRWR